MPLVIGAQVNFAQPDALKGTLVETLKASSLLLCINQGLSRCRGGTYRCHPSIGRGPRVPAM